MLFRVHRSFRRFSNQGFEAAHKLQRQLYLKATSHDSKGYITSLDQILTHLYTEILLELRLSFREAMQCMSTDKAFFYRGCGWRKKIVHWDTEENEWIVKMNNLFNHMFGPDECKCTYTKEKVCVVVEDELPLMDHQHNDWEQIINGGSPNHVEGCITDSTNSKAPTNTSQSGSHNSDSAPTNTSQSHLHDCGKGILTRGETANLQLPKCQSCNLSDVVLVNKVATLTNPADVSVRPRESTVQYALKLLSKHRGQGKAVRIANLGIFDKPSLELYQKACNVADLAVKVKEEQAWLSEPSDLPIRDLLMSVSPQTEILRHGINIMDASDFSTLIGERYLNSFAIDVICPKLVEVSNCGSAVYLPSYSQNLAKQGPTYFKDKVSSYFSQCSVDDTTLIITPVHYEVKQHWGMLCFHIPSRCVYFDDGMKIEPRKQTLTLVRNMLHAFNQLSERTKFNEVEWNSPSLTLPLPRFNMPRQTTTGEGSGSCGVGVILSVRDLVDSATFPPVFAWKFDNMKLLRKQLMISVLSWRSMNYI